jgi:hypothetical protein
MPGSVPSRQGGRASRRWRSARCRDLADRLGGGQHAAAALSEQRLRQCCDENGELALDGVD